MCLRLSLCVFVRDVCFQVLYVLCAFVLREVCVYVCVISRSFMASLCLHACVFLLHRLPSSLSVRMKLCMYTTRFAIYVFVEPFPRRKRHVNSVKRGGEGGRHILLVVLVSVDGPCIVYCHFLSLGRERWWLTGLPQSPAMCVPKRLCRCNAGGSGGGA